MKENHKEDSDQNVKSHEERKYQFIKEQIRPQGREKMRKIVRRIALFCGILILFAVISMSSFYINVFAQYFALFCKQENRVPHLYQNH